MNHKKVMNCNMSKTDSKFNITVVTMPINDVRGEVNLRNLIQTLEPLSSNIFVITGDYPNYSNEKVRIIRLRQTEGKPLPVKMLIHLSNELLISRTLIKISGQFNIVAFHVGARIYVISALISKLLKKKIIAFSFSSSSKVAKIINEQKMNNKMSTINYLMGILERIIFFLADQIAVESESVIKFSNLEKYKGKISIYGAKYMDLRLFEIKKELKDRRELIGYIGFLTELKGVRELVNAFPLILTNYNNHIDFLIGGNGPLFWEVEEMLKRSGVDDRTKLVGEIPHNEVPNHLNEMKLLILPSYSEGISGIVQEAMACGTPVLATPVGGIPDLIKEGKTGFIMENNSPACIAKNVIRALKYPNLDEIVKNARKFIEAEYAYEPMVRKCNDSLAKLMEGGGNIS